MRTSTSDSYDMGFGIELLESSLGEARVSGLVGEEDDRVVDPDVRLELRRQERVGRISR
jgi:hypothetical protein